MKNSVALLIAARTELANHDDVDTIVTNLCRTFDIGTDDARAAVAAARLLADRPGPNIAFRVNDEMPIQRRFPADQTT